LEKYP